MFLIFYPHLKAEDTGPKRSKISQLPLKYYIFLNENQEERGSDFKIIESIETHDHRFL